MAELLREQPYLVAVVILLIAAGIAFWLRRVRGAKAYGEGARREPPDPDSMTDPTPHLRRARIQIVLAFLAILGFTLIGIVNTFVVDNGPSGTVSNTGEEN